MPLADFRRRVADNYAAVRRDGVGPTSWSRWRAGRDALFAEHPESPVVGARGDAFTGMPFFPYDPSWCLAARVDQGPRGSREHAGAIVTTIGEVVAVRAAEEIRLPLMWIEGYGGGLFLPFRDGTNGAETYGGGRYLIDQVKGADLGATDDGRLVLDFNFAYHPSCAHDDRWTCPLAPPGSVINGPVRAGEMLPALP
jgi:uncharacterized protein